MGPYRELRSESGLYVAEGEIALPQVPRETRGYPILGSGLVHRSSAHWATLGGTIAPSHIAAWTAKGAASLAASYVQYGTLGTGLTVGVAPTLGANGWVFNGSSQYLKTGVVPGSSYTIAIQFSNGSSVDSGVIIGVLDSGHLFRIYPYSSNKVFYANGGAQTSVAPGMTSGNLIIAKDQAYRNGASDATITFAVQTYTIEIYIGAENSGGSAVGYSASTVQAVAIYDFQLNGTQAGQLAPKLAAL